MGEFPLILCWDKDEMSRQARHDRSAGGILAAPSRLSSRACREISFLSFLSILFSLTREKKQKRGATPKAPYIGGCKRESRTTDDSRAFLVSRFLVSRDTRYSFLHPCCRRPLERDSQVRDESFLSAGA